MKVIDKVSDAQERVLTAMSSSQDRVVDGVTAARGTITGVTERRPALPTVELPDVELPGFDEVVDNVTDFWSAVLERNRAFAHRLHGAVIAAPAGRSKRSGAKRSSSAKGGGAAKGGSAKRSSSAKSSS